jgi:hypothetical protein
MTKSMKKALILLAVGGAAFALPFGSWWAGGSPACVTNGDLVGFYQTLGVESINAFEDATSNALPAVMGPDSDFDKIVVEPTATVWRGMWNNWVAHRFPLDIGVSGNWLE